MLLKLQISFIFIIHGAKYKNLQTEFDKPKMKKKRNKKYEIN